MMESSHASGSETLLSMLIDYLPCINFAMQQNAAPFFQTLALTNHAAFPLSQVWVRVWTEPAIIMQRTLRVERIAPGASYFFPELDFTFLREPLRTQTEREEGNLWLEVGAEGIAPLRQAYPLSILAYNEWVQSASLPAMLAAHVLPNDPAIERILKHASILLDKHTGDASLSGYQSKDPRRVYAQAAAIYYAAAQCGVSYINPPASFEQSGQKIRTPQQMLRSKLGTCLDTSVLLAACFEQAGLRPIIVLVQEHAFVGLWLVEKSFDDMVAQHASMLLNRLALGELLALESTMITKTPRISFNIAIEQARERLKNEHSFHFALDLQAARSAGIRPLSLTEQLDAGKAAVFAAPIQGLNVHEAFTPPEAVVAAVTPESTPLPRDQESPADRLCRWKNSLLDLSLRNRLLNFKDSNKSIPLLCPNIANLEDVLAANKAFRVRPKPSAWGEQDPRQASLHQERGDENPLAKYLQDQMAQQRLHAAITEDELAYRLIEIERAAHLGFEEGGANTLFLALGFLVWTEAAISDIERRAPILLIPMSIERKSVREGFRIQRLDEESRINITLLQKLKTDFGIELDGLDPLPEDTSGLNVSFILRRIREAIKHEPRWKVEEEAALTILTFSRFLMWLDLEANAEELKKNPVVRHLIEQPNKAFEPDSSFPDVETLDERYPPSMSFCPLHADSSQLRAIHAASEGRTFVLQGPPGTGKSQTITNLIAHCLAVGKRVLFVAQKRAALDVVHKRLHSVGLGPFCLELHSNKSTQESFRAQLRQALGVVVAAPSQHWEQTASRVAEQRRVLNEYARALHSPRSFGKSPYAILTTLIRYSKEPKLRLDLGAIQGRSAEELRLMRKEVRELAEAARLAGNPVAHPLAASRICAWPYGLEDEARHSIEAISHSASEVQSLGKSVLAQVGIALDQASFADFTFACALMNLLETAPSLTKAMLSLRDWPRARVKLEEWINLASHCAQVRAMLLQSNTVNLFLVDIPHLLRTLQQRKESGLLHTWRLEALVRKIMAPVRQPGNNVKDFDALEEELRQAATVIADMERIEAQATILAQLFGAAWQGIASRWEELRQMLAWVDAFRSLLDPEAVKHPTLKAACIQCVTEHRLLFSAQGPAQQQAKALARALQQFDAKRVQLSALLFLDDKLAWGANDDTGMLAKTALTLKKLRENLRLGLEWSQYQAARAVLAQHRLSELVEALEAGHITTEQLTPVFEHSFADWWARSLFHSIPALAQFIGERHTAKIAKFREDDAAMTELARHESFARIAQRLPPPMKEPRLDHSDSEAGLLHRFVKGGRKTIRRIFKDCPNALARYKPCLLMSPLSVAQFIGAEFPRFDLVVFDEASQMPTHEAIGAIARGNQLVVVGDSRQLPPTTFFERQQGDDGLSNDELPEELESILEEAEAARIPSLRLDWHYRSRHESLIAFSNHQYYDNRLHTFPAACVEHPRLGVRWREVADGVYDHGKSRTNRKEAEAVAAEVVQRLRHLQEQQNSLGVVTFSYPQQRLVEDLLEAARRNYPEIEPYFTTVPEPVFVKNLETVQGDERDIILFSICYGPDEAGVLRMNFGPLNNKGGERRLNVAITRARKELLVFSRLRPEQIDTSRSKAEGVKNLKQFLDYAIRGHRALIEAVSRVGGEVESFFEQSVLDELVKRGWRVDVQVGCSGYRIDLAIADPEFPGRYLLGVECDGANYHSAKSARDRDRIRQKVLEGLGWRLHRIWSTDWWRNRGRELEKIEEALRLAREAFAAARATEEEQNQEIIVCAETAEAQSSNESGNEQASEGRRIKAQGNRVTPSSVKLPGQRIYERYQASKMKLPGELHDPANKNTVLELVKEIVAVEAPLLFDALCAQVAASWGLQRSGSRIRTVVMDAVEQNGFPVITHDKRHFVWTAALRAKPYTHFRVGGDNTLRARPVEAICPEEIANAAAQLLYLHRQMKPDELVRESAKLFGFPTVGSKAQYFFEQGIELLKKNGGCRIEGEYLLAQ